MQGRHRWMHPAEFGAERPRGRGKHARPPWRRRGLGVVVVALLVAVVTTDILPASHAQARPIEENHTISVAGSFGNALFTPDNSRISVNQSNQVAQQALEISVMDLSYHPQMTFTFSSRDSSNQYLKVGYYGDAQRYPFTDPGRPGISISPLGFCDDQTGNFEVRELVLSGAAITRIWITYQRYCNSAQPAEVQPAFGEIRLGYPKTSYDVSPRVVRWPAETYPNHSSYDVPVSVRRTGSTAVSVTSVSVSGPTPSSFPIRRHNCIGVLSTTGCVVWVGFVPTSPGPRFARLKVTTTAGTSTIMLDGSGALGRTDWVLDVDHEDPSVPDEHLVLPTSFSWGGPYEFASGAYGSDGIVWRAFFDLAGNATFTQGGHYVYNPDGTGLSLSLSRGNAACELDRATADIANLAFSGPDKRISLLDLTMEAHCRAAYGQTVRGRLRFHDRGDLTGPPRVTNVHAARDGAYVALSWTNPTSADFGRTLVRWYTGGIAPGAPDAGNVASFGTASTVRFAAPSTKSIAISIWAYDTTGNPSARYGLVVAP